MLGLRKGQRIPYLLILALCSVSMLLSACVPQEKGMPPEALVSQEAVNQFEEKAQGESIETAILEPFTTRPAYGPGELVDYTAQSGDTLPALAAHFNTSVDEILKANDFIPADATTMPPGMPMRIPIYFVPFWGNPYQSLPDSQYVNGPAQVGFDVQEFIAGHPGWLNGARAYVAGENRSGGEIVELVARNFSISPRLLLALLEYQSGALSQPAPSGESPEYPLGYEDRRYKGLYLQLVWAANTLNDGYYGWRTGRLSSFEIQGGRLERPDPWQNAASVGLQYYFSKVMTAGAYALAISEVGYARTYASLFGDPWEDVQAHIPGSLQQPEFSLPFQPKRTWAFTGGPHAAWGTGEPLAALDFAPPAVVGGCTPSEEWGTAVAPGVVVRSEPATVVLDLDMDGDERTGWVIFYFHVGDDERAPVGKSLQRGDPIGHPSCEGGRATGTHIHLARKYNGEWIPAEGPLAFNLESWVAKNGAEPYKGSLTRYSRTVYACICSDQKSQLETEYSYSPAP